MSVCSVVVSTSNDRVYGFLRQPLERSVRYVLVHQVYGADSGNLVQADFPTFSGEYVRLDYSGLAKSRNVGIQHVNTKYAYIMDDDVEVDVGSILELVGWMDENEVDVATCQFRLDNGSFPKLYRSKPFKHTMLTAAKVSSIEICVNVDKLREQSIMFDERFGLGAKFPSGEEYVFLADCIKSGLNVWFYPIVTGTHPNLTSGMDFYTTPAKVLAKREMLKRVFGRMSFFFIFAFWLRKMPVVIKERCFIKFSKLLLLGGD